jgi:hypothetical protein
MSTFLMLARRALSMAFWSAARLEEISFFYTDCQRLLMSPSPPLQIDHTCGFSPCLKKASSPVFCVAFSAVKYLGWAISSIFFSSIPARSTFCDVAMT